MGIRKAAIAGGTACVLLTLVAWEWVEGHADVDYRTATVGRGDIDVTVSATGNPNAVVTVQVGSQVSGNIQALFADFNTKVSKGQLIARIDPAPFQTKVNQAHATLDAARANIQASTSSLAAAVANVTKAEALVEDARFKVDRRVVMLAENATAKEDLETAQTDLHVGCRRS
jgi:HlyD family secretion protein